MMETNLNETLTALLDTLGVEVDEASPALLELAESNTRYLKDLRINLSNALNYPHLTEREKILLVLAVAINEKNPKLEQAFLRKAVSLEIPKDLILECYSCVSMLNVNNVFYRFRHFTRKPFYEDTPAGIKMSVMINPASGKEFFELMSLAVSALNGCELCVSSHEHSLRELGTSEQRIYDAIRLTAIIKGTAVLLN